MAPRFGGGPSVVWGWPTLGTMRAVSVPERERLSAEARAIWDRHVAEQGTPATATRRDLLAAYSACLAQLEQVQGRLATEGLIIADDKGRPVEHPALKIQAALVGQVDKLAAAVR